MKKRSPAAVLIFGIITLGIYIWYWSVKTKTELNTLQPEKIPTAWIWLIPLVGYIWWLWKYSQAVETVTHEKMNAVLTFILIWILGGIGAAILQDTFNKVDATPVSAGAGSDVAPTQPLAVTPTAPTPDAATSTSTDATPAATPASPETPTPEAPESTPAQDPTPAFVPPSPASPETPTDNTTSGTQPPVVG